MSMLNAVPTRRNVTTDTAELDITTKRVADLAPGDTVQTETGTYEVTAIDPLQFGYRRLRYETVAKNLRRPGVATRGPRSGVRLHSNTKVTVIP
jgi:hypothetical protein